MCSPPNNSPSAQHVDVPTVKSSSGRGSSSSTKQRQPTKQPSMQPRRLPSRQPGVQPSQQPLLSSVMEISYQPTQQSPNSPSKQPTEQFRSNSPSTQPVDVPTVKSSSGRQLRVVPVVRPSRQAVDSQRSSPVCNHADYHHDNQEFSQANNRC